MNLDVGKSMEPPVASLKAFARFSEALDSELVCFFSFAPLEVVHSIYLSTLYWFPVGSPNFTEFRATLKSTASAWMRNARHHPKCLAFVREHLLNSIKLWPVNPAKKAKAVWPVQTLI